MHHAHSFKAPLLMAKHFFQSWLPSPEKVSQLKFIKVFGQRAFNPVLWYVNRRSISLAVLIGTFWGILPVPFHSVFIVLTVLLIEANLPLSLTLAWLSNPLTVVPILYLGFWLGSRIFQVNMIDQDMLLGVFHQILHWAEHFGQGHIDFHLAKILLAGLMLEALLGAILLYLLTRILWRWSVIRKWNKRIKRMALNPR